MDTLAEISGHFAAKWLDSGFRNQVDSIAETSTLTYHIRFGDQENSKLFEQELNKITGRNTTMGIRELLLDRAKHEGKLEGKLEGQLEGKQEYQLEIAREMKKDKFPIETIVKLTKLAAAKIRRL